MTTITIEVDENRVIVSHVKLSQAAEVVAAQTGRKASALRSTWKKTWATVFTPDEFIRSPTGDILVSLAGVERVAGKKDGA